MTGRKEVGGKEQHAYYDSKLEETVLLRTVLAIFSHSNPIKSISIKCHVLTAGQTDWLEYGLHNTASAQNEELPSIWLNDQASRGKSDETVLLRIALVGFKPDKIDFYKMSRFGQLSMMPKDVQSVGSECLPLVCARIMPRARHKNSEDTQSLVLSRAIDFWRSAAKKVAQQIYSEFFLRWNDGNCRRY